MAPNEKSRAGRVTEVLEELRRDRPGAEEELFRLVYAEMHRLAATQMGYQRPDHTLQPTALVHEAYIRLVKAPGAGWKDRAHFLAAAARSMRTILVDFARRRATKKRGGGLRRVTFDESSHAGLHAADEVLAVHEALTRLEEIDTQGARVVELRFFGGLTAAETARVLGVAESTVYLAWEHARSWLFREMAP